MFGIKELKRQVKYLEGDRDRLNSKYWDLSRKHDLLCEYFGVNYTEQHFSGYEAKASPESVKVEHR